MLPEQRGSMGVESDSWIHFPSHSGGSGDEYYFEEDYFEDHENESQPEYLCPFCTEKFDMIGLRCHIDKEHPIESNNGVCPVCAKSVGIELVSHVTQQHGDLLIRTIYKNLISDKKPPCKNRYFKSQLKPRSHSLVSSSMREPDPRISSFMSNPATMVEPLLIKECDRKSEMSASSYKDQEEKARRCAFVQGLIISTFLNDNL